MRRGKRDLTFTTCETRDANVPAVESDISITRKDESFPTDLTNRTPGNASYLLILDVQTLFFAERGGNRTQQHLGQSQTMWGEIWLERTESL
jgi:hypothetical protein